MVGVRLLLCFNENSDHQDVLFPTTLLFTNCHGCRIIGGGLCNDHGVCWFVFVRFVSFPVFMYFLSVSAMIFTIDSDIIWLVSKHNFHLSTADEIKANYLTNCNKLYGTLMWIL